MTFVPPTNQYLRVIPTPRGPRIVLGLPGGKTFDIHPREGVKLGLALIENSSHILQQKEAAMPTQTTLERVARIAVEHLGVDAEKVTPEADFAADLGADSLDKVELVMALEDEFAVEILDEDAEKTNTIGEAVALIDRLTK